MEFYFKMDIFSFKDLGIVSCVIRYKSYNFSGICISFGHILIFQFVKDSSVFDVNLINTQ